MSPVKYNVVGRAGRLTSGEVLTYLVGVYKSQLSSQAGAISVRASKRHDNIVFFYQGPKKEKHPLELVLGALYVPGKGQEPDTVSIIPHGINQTDAKRFLEHHVYDDSIFEDSGDLRADKKQAHSWRNILKRVELNPNENAKTICQVVNKSADAWDEVLPAIKGYMAQPWVVFLAHHMQEPQ